MDAIASAIDRCAQKVELLPTDIRKARERIGDHELDVLFYPEIGLLSRFHRGFEGFKRLDALLAAYGIEAQLSSTA